MHNIKKSWCFGIDNSTGALNASFVNPEDPTEAELIAHILATPGRAVRANDLVVYTSPSGAEFQYLGGIDATTELLVLHRLRGETSPLCGREVTTATVDWDSVTTHNRQLTLAGDATPTFTATEVCWYTLEVVQDGTSTITWPANVLWSGTAPQPVVGAGAVSVFQFYFDGTNFHGRS